MISSTVWACMILSPATLHLVSGTTWCRCVTRPAAVPDRWPTVLASGCSHIIAACLTALTAQSCWTTQHCGKLLWPGCRSAVLARPCNLPTHTSHWYLMDRMLHALQTQEQSLSRSDLADTRTYAPMKITMAGSAGNFYLIACSL
jgi:hypothetical protein